MLESCALASTRQASVLPSPLPSHGQPHLLLLGTQPRLPHLKLVPISNCPAAPPPTATTPVAPVTGLLSLSLGCRPRHWVQYVVASERMWSAGQDAAVPPFDTGKTGATPSRGPSRTRHLLRPKQDCLTDRLPTQRRGCQRPITRVAVCAFRCGDGEHREGPRRHAWQDRDTEEQADKEAGGAGAREDS